MVDALTKAQRSALMKRILGKDTLPERTLRAALRHSGLKGWRSQGKGLPGRPDLYYPHLRIAIFVDGAFWHGHPSKFHPGRLSDFWERKIVGNRKRDRKADRALRGLGWTVIRVWDLDVRRRLAAVLERITKAVAVAGGFRTVTGGVRRTPGARRRTAGPKEPAGSASPPSPGSRRLRASRTRRARSSRLT